MLTKAHRQQALSFAYVEAVAAAAGVSCNRRRTDYGIDLTLSHIQRNRGQHTESGLHIDVQVKSTAGHPPADSLSYDLDVRGYNLLCADPVTTPRLLALLVLPTDDNSWVDATADHLLLRHSAYWLSLRGRPPSDNRRTVRVTLPRTQLLTVGALRQLFVRVR